MRVPVLVLVVIASVAPLFARPHTSPPEVVFTGEVESGNAFDREIGRKLFFHLDPEPDVGAGWNIEIVKKGDLSDERNDFIAVATPPYQGFNPRYLSTGYDYTAASAVALTPRRFYFVESAEDFKIADREVNIHIYPHHAISDEIDQADEDAVKVKVGRGRLIILDSRITPATDKSPRGTIDWIKFEVHLDFDPGLNFNRVFARSQPKE